MKINIELNDEDKKYLREMVVKSHMVMQEYNAILKRRNELHEMIGQEVVPINKRRKA